MEFEVTDVIAYPLDTVFPTFRDKLVEMSAFYPNIEEVRVEQREEKGDEVRQVATWVAKAQLPGPLEKLVPQTSRRWLDNAVWHNAEHYVSWRIEPAMFAEATSLTGETRFTASTDMTRVTMKGRLDIDPRKIKGVPAIVAKRLLPTIEKFVSSTIKKNFMDGNRNTEKYLAAQKS